MCSTIERKIKRFLFIGPTGVGKSTLINVLFNENVEKQSLLKPASTSDGPSGSTRSFITYYKTSEYTAFTDSVGFGDPRFDERDILSMLKAVVKNAVVGYNKIYLCIQYGRISEEKRHYIDLLIVLFGKKILKWCTIIFTHCSDQTMTKEKYLAQFGDDKYIIEILNSVQNVIFGDNQTDQEEDIENLLIKRRKRLLDNLKEDMKNANKNYYSPQPENFKEWLLAIYNMITLRYAKQIKGCYEEIQQITGVMMNLVMEQNFAHYYGECPICSNDMWNTDSVLTKCHHIFHETCIKNWLNRNNTCPMCRGSINKTDTFLTPIYIDWECIETSDVDHNV